MGEWVRWGLLVGLLGVAVGRGAGVALDSYGVDTNYSQAIGMLLTIAVSEGIRRHRRHRLEAGEVSPGSVELLDEPLRPQQSNRPLTGSSRRQQQAMRDFS